jgi:hypothetical protein
MTHLEARGGHQFSSTPPRFFIYLFLRGRKLAHLVLSLAAA